MPAKSKFQYVEANGVDTRPQVGWKVTVDNGQATLVAVTPGGDEVPIVSAVEASGKLLRHKTYPHGQAIGLTTTIGGVVALVGEKRAVRKKRKAK